MSVEPSSAGASPVGPPREPYAKLFLRFLRFGALAWGGPFAQIAMVREELVERERWISRQRFNRVLSVYQALPGPEAHELCVYFGYVARGRLGGVLAGLGFMLPGFALMLTLSWAYVRFGLKALAPAGLFLGFQAAVLALIVKAIERIGRHVLIGPWLWGIAAVALAADLAGTHFAVTLGVAGAAHAAVGRRRPFVAVALIAAAAATVALVPALREAGTTMAASAPRGADPGLARLFGAGLLAGLLTFGGAYTVIPFLRREAVGAAGWMSNAQFVDGLALSGALPAPLVIFGTFVGYVGGGFPGALVVSAGIFLPAFSFTLIGHARIERLVEDPRFHAFLDGVAAAVVGLITATTFRLAPTALPGVRAGVIFGLAVVALWLWRAKAAIAVVVLAAGGLGMLLTRL